MPDSTELLLTFQKQVKNSIVFGDKETALPGVYIGNDLFTPEELANPSKIALKVSITKVFV
jgi:hypothetical protein